MWRITVIAMSLMLAMTGTVAAQAQSDPPVVQIPGRPASRLQVSAPVVVQLQSVMPDAEDAGEDAPATPGASAPASEEGGAVSVPVGAIMAWTLHLTNTPPLPPGWMRCDGQKVDDRRSPFHGQHLPNLNSTEGDGGRFLRGSPESGQEGGSLTHTHGSYRSQKYGTQRSPVAATLPVDHLPPFYTVIWIMRVH